MLLVTQFFFVEQCVSEKGELQNVDNGLASRQSGVSDTIVEKMNLWFHVLSKLAKKMVKLITLF